MPDMAGESAARRSGLDRLLTPTTAQKIMSLAKLMRRTTSCSWLELVPSSTLSANFVAAFVEISGFGPIRQRLRQRQPTKWPKREAWDKLWLQEAFWREIASFASKIIWPRKEQTLIVGTLLVAKGGSV